MSKRLRGSIEGKNDSHNGAPPRKKCKSTSKKKMQEIALKIELALGMPRMPEPSTHKNRVAKFLDNLLGFSMAEKVSFIKKYKHKLDEWSHVLLLMLSGSYFGFLDRAFSKIDHVDDIMVSELDDTNAFKLSIINRVCRSLSNEFQLRCYKPAILTCFLVTRGGNRGVNRSPDLTTTLFGGAIDCSQAVGLSLLTSQCFLNSIWEFDLIRFESIASQSLYMLPLSRCHQGRCLSQLSDAFCRRDVTPRDVDAISAVDFCHDCVANGIGYIPTFCDDNLILEWLRARKHKRRWRTFLFLLFLMCSYYKTVMLDTIKTEVMKSYQMCNDDVFSVIMSYSMGYYEVLHSFFSCEDEHDGLMRSLMIEASEASDGWVDILKTVLSKDKKFGKLWEASLLNKAYVRNSCAYNEQCEELSLLSYRLYAQKYDIETVKTWMVRCVELKHSAVFEAVLDGMHCSDHNMFCEIVIDNIQYKAIKANGEDWEFDVKQHVKSLKKKMIMNKDEKKKFAEKWTQYMNRRVVKTK